MKNREIKKLGEVCTYSKGKKPKFLSSEKSERNSIPYINIKAFEKGIFDEYTDGEKCNLCEEGDLLMVWDGARAGFTGKAKKGAIGSTLMKIEPINGVEKNYIFYFLLSLYKKLNTNPRGVGIPHVEPLLLWNSELVIPPLSEQQAIVQKIEELFSELDKSIENLKTAQQQLKTYRQSVLKSAFEGKLTSKKEDENLMIVAEPNLEYGEKKLPEGWKWETLQNLIEVKDGTHDTPKYVEKGIPFITQKNIKTTGLNFEDVKYISQLDHDKFYKRSNVAKNDLIFSMIGANRGMVCIVDTSEIFSIKNVGLLKYSPTVLNPKYLLYFLKSHYALNYVKSLSKGGAQEFVGLKELRGFPIIYCHLLIQEEIVAEIESRFSVADKLEESINQSLLQAETLRQSILKKAFEGKLIK